VARVRVKVVRRRAGGTSRVRAAAAGILGGFVVGFALWSRELVARKRDLFSPRPMRRLAALGYLAGNASPETVQLLREYVVWEKHAPLRARAVRLLRRVERDLA
jgi:hypothetical protein